MSKSLLFSLLALALGAASDIALASGNHAGGHGAQADIGKPGKATKNTRTVVVDMNDAMRFTPAQVTVKQGETVRFVVTNSGKLKHEMVLGTEKEIKEHYETMKKFPGMEHEDPQMVTVEPSKTKDLVWTFTKSGSVEFACLQVGHYDEGMKGQVQVTAEDKKGARKTPS